MLTIDHDSARRFILGKQGLWPGRRWHGLEGIEQAMCQMEYLQLDPLQIIARSQDIKLYSRVLDYTPGMWEDVTYGQRKFFDWGGWLAVRAMEDLPYWRLVMRRELEAYQGLKKTAREHAEAIDEMRDILRERKTVTNRDFKMSSRKRTESYRGRKDSAVALYHLWRTGEVMTHHRENFERVYALTENVAPAHLIYEADDGATNRFLIKKGIAFAGLSKMSRAADSMHVGVSAAERQQLIQSMLADGDLVEIQVEGWKGTYYAHGSDVAIIDELSAGRIPEMWQPLETTTTDETTFLAPLDPVSARGRASVVFDFDYVWEVYKPKDKRKYGYYVLPILWGDRLVGRFDSKLDRKTNTYMILNLWLEDEALGSNDDFANALAKGFERFTRFLGAEKLDASAVQQTLLRKRLRVKHRA